MPFLRCHLAWENGSLFKKKSSLLRNLGQQIGFAIKIANLLRKPQLVASAKTFAKLQDVVYM
jgi:hypothetical protein